MGAWGTQFDENDGALDFLSDVGDSRDWTDVSTNLIDYVENGGYDSADEAVAALELVAAALGKPSPRLPTDFARWAEQHAAEAQSLKACAAKAVELVVEKSELSELWAEADEGDDWQAGIADLRARLRA